MNLKPLNDILVIKRIMDEQPRTSSGILLPPTEEAADTPYTGVVLGCSSMQAMHYPASRECRGRRAAGRGAHPDAGQSGRQGDLFAAWAPDIPC